MGHQQVSRAKSYSQFETTSERYNLNFGVSFVLVFFGMIIFTYHEPEETRHTAQPMIGMTMILVGLLSLFLSKRINKFIYRNKVKNIRTYPKWRRDYPWGESNILKDDILYRLIKLVYIGVALFFFLVIFSITDFPIIIVLILLIFNGIIFFKLIMSSMEYYDFGISSLFMNNYPQLIGETVSLTYKNTRMGSSYKLLYTSLKFIQEIVTYEETSDGKEKKITYVEKYKDIMMVPLDNGVAHIKIDLPKDAKSNHLSLQNACYWVLDIEASDTKEKSFETTFLLPIYDKTMLVVE